MVRKLLTKNYSNGLGIKINKCDMKKAILIISISFLFVQCNKNKVEYSDVNTIVLNQTIGGPGASAFNISYGLDEDGVNTSSDQNSLDYYLSSINPTSGTKEVLFTANDYHLHFTETSQSNLMKNFSVGDVVSNADAQGNRGNLGVEGVVLEEGTTTNFPLNSIGYIGISYANGISGFLNGWVKIKTDSSYSSCTVISYSIATDYNMPVEIVE